MSEQTATDFDGGHPAMEQVGALARRGSEAIAEAMDGKKRESQSAAFVAGDAPAKSCPGVALRIHEDLAEIETEWRAFEQSADTARRFNVSIGSPNARSMWGV